MDFLEFIKWKLFSQAGNFDVGEMVAEAEGGGESDGPESFDDLENGGENLDYESEEKDSQVDLLTPKKEGEEKPKKEKEEKEEEKKEAIGEEKEGEKKETPKTNGKTIKARLGDEKLEVAEDMELLVTVDGSKERVTLKDLRDNYAGKTVWEKKFAELNNFKKEYEGERGAYDQEKNEIVATLKNARGLLDEAMTGNKDPREAVNYLIDLMGYDSYDFNIALMNHMYGDISELSNMSEAEREAYWAKKEVDHLKTRNENLERSTKTKQQQAAHRNQVDQLRQAHGVSEEMFVKALEDLQNSGMKDVSAEQVIERAALLPIVDKALDLCSPYEEDLSDSEMNELLIEVTTFMRNHPNHPVELIQNHLDELYRVNPLVGKLGQKVGAKSAIRHEEEEEDEEFTTFDDLF